MREKNSDTLIITYGRLYNEAIKLRGSLKNEGINCDILKLTKIFPLDDDLIRDKEVQAYRIL